MKRFLFVLLLILICGAVLFSCNNSDEPSATTEPKTSELPSTGEKPDSSEPVVSTDIPSSSSITEPVGTTPVATTATEAVTTEVSKTDPVTPEKESVFKDYLGIWLDEDGYFVYLKLDDDVLSVKYGNWSSPELTLPAGEEHFEVNYTLESFNIMEDSVNVNLKSDDKEVEAFLTVSTDKSIITNIDGVPREYFKDPKHDSYPLENKTFDFADFVNTHTGYWKNGNDVLVFYSAFGSNYVGFSYIGGAQYEPQREVMESLWNWDETAVLVRFDDYFGENWFVFRDNDSKTIIVYDVNLAPVEYTHVAFESLDPTYLLDHFGGHWQNGEDIIYVYENMNKVFISFDKEGGAQFAPQKEVRYSFKSWNWDTKGQILLLLYDEDNGEEWYVLYFRDDEMCLHKSIENPDYYVKIDNSPGIPTISEAVKMGESKALEILSNYHARDIANFWADYIIEDKDFFVTYKDPESGKKIKLMADDGYCIVIVQIY